MELSKFRMPSISNNFLVWAIVIFILLGFSNVSSSLGINVFSPPQDKQPINHKHYQDGKYPNKPPIINPIKGNVFPLQPASGLGGVLGGNGLFVIAVIALLFLCKDDEAKDNESEVCNDVYSSDDVISIDDNVEV